MGILMKAGLHQPDPTGYKWKRDFIFSKGFVQPGPTRGEMCILMKKGLPQPDLTRYKWKRDFIFP